MNKIRVLVTGAGSGVGQGIFKALRLSKLPLHLIFADVSPLNAGLYRSDESVLLPKVESEGSLPKIIEAIRQLRVDVVMVGSEFDLSFFAQNRATIENETKALVVASPAETVAIANDKWLTAEFLRKNDLAYPKSFLPNSLADAETAAAQIGYPLVLKTRTGTSSRHVHILPNAAALNERFANVPNPMLQERINAPSSKLSHEYTCSVFKTADGSILGPFTARRTLHSGNSWHVEVKVFAELFPLLLSIAKHIDFMGSLNVQLMINPQNAPIPFEFNARFSGTTAIRAHFGFNEPEMAIRSYLLKEKLTAPLIRSGMVLKYMEEVFIDNAEAATIDPQKFRGEVHPWL